MILFEHIETSGFEAAIRGMRNPKDSWDKSDSYYVFKHDNDELEYTLGKNDLSLASKLHSSGPVHSKYKRMIVVTLDITAPLYWWKEYDTYKVGTVANSCSTMHKIQAYPFTREMFSCEHLTEENLKVLDVTIEALNKARDLYNAALKDTSISNDEKKKIWWQMIQLLPTSFNQKRTVMLNYEVLTNIYTWRHDHKQDEWREFCKMIESLPCAKDIILPKGITLN